jgi:hypothetical protein
MLKTAVRRVDSGSMRKPDTVTELGTIESAMANIS